MLRFHLTLPQVRPVPIKCGTRPAEIHSYASQRDPVSRTIDADRRGDLHDTVVRAMLTSQRNFPDAGLCRTLITRACATGVDRYTEYPTSECLRAICLLPDTAVTGLAATN